MFENGTPVLVMILIILFDFKAQFNNMPSLFIRIYIYILSIKKSLGKKGIFPGQY